jgi:hypothetical protein
MRSVTNALWPELTSKSLLSPHFAMPSKGINRDVIASRAELWSKYGRPTSCLPNIRQIQAWLAELSPLSGMDILEKTDPNQVREHAGPPIGDKRQRHPRHWHKSHRHPNVLKCLEGKPGDYPSTDEAAK